MFMYILRVTLSEYCRITSENIALQSGNLQRSITYLPGEQTDEHIANGKCKTDATTNLVNQITNTGGRTLSYTYDCNGIRSDTGGIIMIVR